MELKRFQSPVVVVCATAVLVVAIFGITRYFGLGAQAVDPKVTLEFGKQTAGKQTAAGRSGVPTIIDGEVARTADRIGEVTALALSANLYAAREQAMGRTPRTVRDLLAGVASQNLLPPGFGFTRSEGVLASSNGTLAVRYRPLPLGIEVVSIGNQPEDGPALLVRVPDELSDKGEAKLFIADSLAAVKVPAPFATSAEVIASGWSPERWHSIR